MDTIKMVYNMANQLKMFGQKYAWYAGTKVMLTALQWILKNDQIYHLSNKTLNSVRWWKTQYKYTDVFCAV